MKYTITMESPELFEAIRIVKSAMPAIPTNEIAPQTAAHLEGTHVQSFRDESGSLVGFANYELFDNGNCLYLAGRAVARQHQGRLLWQACFTSYARCPYATIYRHGNA